MVAHPPTPLAVVAGAVSRKARVLLAPAAAVAAATVAHTAPGTATGATSPSTREAAWRPPCRRRRRSAASVAVLAVVMTARSSASPALRPGRPGRGRRPLTCGGTLAGPASASAQATRRSASGSVARWLR